MSFAGKAKLASFPPSFTPLPCKPLFFDLAREQLAFPDDLVSKAKVKDAAGAGGAGGQAGGAGAGWLGGWLGGWKK